MTTLSVETRRESSLGGDSKGGLSGGSFAWRWMVVACALLGISGGVRFWREYQFRAKAEDATVCPFPLKELATELGTWRALEGSDSQLDPQIARIAGTTDHLIRAYMDEKTGERVTALVLYGLAPNVAPHIPEVCFPATGFTLLRPMKEKKFRLPEVGIEGGLRTACYVRRTPTNFECVEVCYGFWYNGNWRPEIQSFWKQFRYHPATFKIQLQRQLPGIPDEDNLDDLLEESLYKLMVAEISKVVHVEPVEGVVGGVSDGSAVTGKATGATADGGNSAKRP